MIAIQVNKEHGEVLLHLDLDGINRLMELFGNLIQSNKTDHFHLMSREWSSSPELSVARVDEKYSNIHHLKVMCAETKWLELNVIQDSKDCK